LSEEIGKDLSLLVGSIFTKDIVEALSAGIKDFSESLKSGEFKKGVKDFGQAIAGMAKGVIALAKSMGLITDPKTPEEQKEREEWEKKSPWEKFKASVLLDPNKVKKIAPKLLPSSSDGTDAPGVHIPHGMGAAGSIAWRHNNPGNLMFIGQLGASMGEPKKGGGHWARFASPELGWMAAVNDIRAKQRQGLTLAGLINKYAPSSENNTAEYIRKVASQLGVSPNTPASQISAVELAKKIVAYESGTGVTSHRFIKKTLKNAGHYDPLAKALADRYGSGPDIAETSRNAEDHISLLEKILKEHRKAAQQKKEGITINNNSSANVARSANALS